MSNDAPVLLELDGPIATIRLNRPDEGNRLTTPVFTLLARYLDDLARDGAIRVLCLTAAGPDFSLGRRGTTTEPLASAFHEEFRLVQACNEALAAFPGISLALVRGRAVGAGCSLACRCDVVLAADDARFSFPEIPQGIAPTIVLSYFGKKLPAKPLLHMLLTGREIDPEEAQRIGLVSEVVPAAQFGDRGRELARQFAGLDANVVGLCKEFLGRLDRLTVDDAAAYGIARLAIAAEESARQQAAH